MENEESKGHFLKLAKEPGYFYFADTPVGEAERELEAVQKTYREKVDIVHEKTKLVRSLKPISTSNYPSKNKAFATLDAMDPTLQHQLQKFIRETAVPKVTIKHSKMTLYSRKKHPL